MRAAGVIGLGLALALSAGCDRAAEPAAPAEAVSQTAAHLPLSFARATPDAEVRLTLPPAVEAYPALHAELYRGEVRSLEAFLAAARDDHGAEIRAGLTTPAYQREAIWSVMAQTGRFLSLVREETVFSGGAHPNSDLRAMLVDRRAMTELQPAAFFRPDADFGALDRALCAAVGAARRERAAGEPVDTETFECPTWRASRFALAPSTTAGKAGGLVFLFAPYAVGAYAEGVYEVVVPLAVFREALSPAVAAEFAGAPAALPRRPEPVLRLSPEDLLLAQGGDAAAASRPAAVVAADAPTGDAEDR